MKEVKIVIGANWGDEGKGLITEYFASKKNSLVVCHNGGCQKGHTITTPSGIRHVFHHFGAGSFVGADTYLAKTYILNPMIFREEYNDLKSKNANTKCYINSESIFTTPYDILMNQLIESIRNKNRHGSCGMGIFETVHRNDYDKLPLKDFIKLTNNEKIIVLKEIRDYFLKVRIKELNIQEIPDEIKNILFNENVIYNYLDDLNFMLSNVEIVDDSIFDKYDRIVFEGAQGLALDQNNMKYWPNLTPSNTGSKNPIEMITAFDLSSINVEVCYVTRSYYTRHGAGGFEFICKKEDLNPDIVDLTNVPNPYQETIKYGFLDVDDLLERINNDFNLIKINTKKSIAITHLNYSNGKFLTKNGEKEIKLNDFDKIYKSNTQLSKDIM